MTRQWRSWAGRLKRLGCIGCLVTAMPWATEAQQTVLISITTTNPTPLNLGFAGFCTEMLTDAVEYGDTNFQRVAATLSPGWLRYPGGATEDAFDWTNGVTLTNWISMFPAAETNLLWPSAILSNGKGGAKFTDFAALCGQVGGARIVVTVNGFTDTAASAGAFAAFAVTNHIPVAAWELCNEPYVFANPHSPFFLNSTDYVAKMRPYRDAIKAADSNAVVAIYFSDAGFVEPAWDLGLSNYPDKYWDAVIYHHYPQISGNPFPNLMALDNWELASNTTSRVRNYLMPMNRSNVTYIVSEYAPADGNGSGGQYPPTTTLYGGIYAAEYLLRLSAVPQMSFVGPYQLLDASGINVTNEFYNVVSTAYHAGPATNTEGLPFGFFLSAQGCGSAVANGALTRSLAVYPTTVGGNGTTVPVDVNNINSIPALYAQAYQGGNGKRYVVITNKGATSVPVQIVQDAAGLTNQFLETFISGSDPGAVNSSPQNSPVQIQTATVANPVTIPGYSVVRLEWTVAAVASPTLGAMVSNGVSVLAWSGEPNVVYNVLGATNLAGPWTTLGRVVGSQPACGFTNWAAGGARFYRLAVP